MATHDRTDETTAAEERAERQEMFSIHPAIFQTTAQLPRKDDGEDYAAFDAGQE